MVEKAERQRESGRTGRHLAELQRLAATPARLRRLKKVLASEPLDMEAAFKLVSRDAYGTALALSVPMTRVRMLEGFGEEELKSAKRVLELLEGKLSFLMEDPRLLEAVRGERVAPSKRKVYRTISNIMATSSYQFESKRAETRLSPSLRLVFFGVDGEPLLDTQGEWSEIARIVAELAALFEAEVKAVRELLSSLSLVISERDVDAIVMSLKRSEESARKSAEIVRNILPASKSEPAD